MKAKVYFSKQITPEKVVELYKAVGLELPGKVAVKVHSGEPGNQNFLTPEFWQPMVEAVHGTIVECNTAYPGERNTTDAHRRTMIKHGWSKLFDVDILDAEGPDLELPIPNGKRIQKNLVGKDIKNYDSMLVLSHFKGHPMGGFGGALKNIGMGCGSRAGKEEMHSSGKPVVDQDKCIGCGKCVENCAHNGPHIENGKCTILKYKCTGCGRCINVCPMHAIHADYAIANELLNCKIAEYAKAVVDGRPSFHIALAVDVSPCCDCHNFSDVPIVPNVGMFASFDPVALDTACADMINAQPVNPNSVIAHEHDHPHDHFTAAHPDTDWRAAVEHGEAIGLGTTHYELVTV